MVYWIFFLAVRFVRAYSKLKLYEKPKPKPKKKQKNVHNQNTLQKFPRFALHTQFDLFLWKIYIKYFYRWQKPLKTTKKMCNETEMKTTQQQQQNIPNAY